jgi:retinol dehydrogenase 12
MKTELQRHGPPPMRAIMGAIFKGPKYGAYTELYASLSDSVENGGYYVPWGRPGVAPDHLNKSLESANGKLSVADQFYEWCEKEVSPFF